MSIEIVTFPGAPAVSEEAVKREAELDTRIEALVKGTRTNSIFLMRGEHEVLELNSNGRVGIRLEISSMNQE